MVLLSTTCPKPHVPNLYSHYMYFYAIGYIIQYPKDNETIKFNSYLSFTAAKNAYPWSACVAKVIIQLITCNRVRQAKTSLNASHASFSSILIRLVSRASWVNFMKYGYMKLRDMCSRFHAARPIYNVHTQHTIPHSNHCVIFNTKGVLIGQLKQSVALSCV